MMNARTAAGENIFTNGEAHKDAKKNGNGARRNKMPLNGILWRMANKILHERAAPKGPKVRASKLSEDDVREIRRTHNGRRECVIALAEKFGISAGYVEKIALGETHKYVL